MTSFELKIWRRGMGWDQERAAEELGVGIATYKRYEKAGSLKRTVVLATRALSLEAMMPEQ